MRDAKSIKLLILFAMSFSLVSVYAPQANHANIFPHLQLARANPAPVEAWYPAGPAMDTEKVSIFTDKVSEHIALTTPGAGTAGSVDLTDEPLPLTLIGCLRSGVGCPPGINPADFFVTSSVAEHGYFELQFLLANNFWGCDFSFGNAACGVNVRQGIAHLIDKSAFATNAPNCTGFCQAIDNPVPPSDGLVTPNPCNWDSIFPQVGPTCVVGPPPTGGISYHLVPAAAGAGPTFPLFAWEPGFGTPDFCAAADHFIAAGIAAGKNAVCVLTGLAPSVTAHPVNVYASATDLSTLQLGQSTADELCALFTGVFRNVGSPSCPIVAGTTVFPAGSLVTLFSSSFTNFPGFATSNGAAIAEDWGIYTAMFINVFPFDSSLYGTYNSVDASNNGPFAGFGIGDVPPCGTASVPSRAAEDYMYACLPAYDAISNQMKFAPCISAPGGPIPGQVTPTFSNCPGTTQLTAVSAGYQAEDLFGRNALTIPVFSRIDLFGYLSTSTRVINSAGAGIPQFWTWLDAQTNPTAAPGGGLANCPATGPIFLPAAAQPIIGNDCIRQGFAEHTYSLNPYAANTFWDFNIIGNIYDSLMRENPMDNTQLICWMTFECPVELNNAQLGYTPPPGTIASFRFNLENDIFQHDGHAITAWDAKFTYLTLKAVGAYQSSGLAPLTDVHVLSPRVFDINLSNTGPFTLFEITYQTILSGRDWSTCGAATWDSDVVAGNVPNTCMVVPPSKASPLFDPIANGLLIGSGPWQCAAIAGLPNPSGVIIGGGCSSTGTQNPGAGGSYQLTSFGSGTTPGAGFPSTKYFKSSGTLAEYIWSGNNGNSVHDFVNISAIAFCFLKPVGTAGCTPWQQGIGNPAAPPGAPVGFIQVSTAIAFNAKLWVGPFSWLPGISYACCPFTSNPPTGIADPTQPPNTLVLYESISTGNPGNPFPAGTPQILKPASVVGCAMAYPVGGYDC